MPFSAPNRSLGKIDPATTATLIAAAADVALVIDREGIIQDVALNSDDLSTDLTGCSTWIGRPWVDTVTIESRSKIEALLKEAVPGRSGRSRQINYPSVQQADVPILYSAVSAGTEGSVVAFGRNLKQFSVLQRRLVEAQQTMERDYSRLHHVETRYRLLFSVSAEPVLIVDADSQKVIEANPAAADMFGEAVTAVIDKPLVDVFGPQSTSPLQSLLAVVRAAGHADDVRANLRHSGEEVLVSAYMFRQENASLFLVRLLRLTSDSALGVVPKMTWKLLKLVENSPDGFVVTDADGRIVSANAAFLDMAQLATDRQAVNQKLDRWLGRPGVDLDVLIANLTQRGTVRLFGSSLQGQFGTETAVEISAASVMNSERRCFGFAIRNIARRFRTDMRFGPDLPGSVEHLTELVGRVSLKDLVREATDVIERLSIQAALKMTGDNRASAAEMLGVSRQSLYVKLRRYGLADPTGENGSDVN
ncbi:transcriptional regulator PpsR [Lichenifustis flavocetrariae]|uniref:Transcriptional regulator PpsR n=1 Tax=Lichenifustis flavocetrariae TaxID=2949735 RepID=A0AA41YSD7_9HYPH|nr:transcriptional regulator PpsR [Lichenifustis flavocetrariae]MCW6507299.1 transcriptional regulator PpsR [Lichenifustis flavocetrariae]